MNVIIYRGIPGAGKTRLADHAMVVSADDYMVGEGEDEGKYKWQPERKDECHKLCLRRYLKLLHIWAYRQTPDVLAVDNTNIRAAEIAPYYALAQAFDLDVEILTVVCDPALAAQRNVHGVDAKTVYRMHLLLEAETLTMPSWWKQRVVFSW